MRYPTNHYVMENGGEPTIDQQALAAIRMRQARKYALWNRALMPSKILQGAKLVYDSTDPHFKGTYDLTNEDQARLEAGEQMYIDPYALKIKDKMAEKQNKIDKLRAEGQIERADKLQAKYEKRYKPYQDLTGVSFYKPTINAPATPTVNPTTTTPQTDATNSSTNSAMNTTMNTATTEETVEEFAYGGSVKKYYEGGEYGEYNLDPEEEARRKQLLQQLKQKPKDYGPGYFLDPEMQNVANYVYNYTPGPKQSYQVSAPEYNVDPEKQAMMQKIANDINNPMPIVSGGIGSGGVIDPTLSEEEQAALDKNAGNAEGGSQENLSLELKGGFNGLGMAEGLLTGLAGVNSIFDRINSRKEEAELRRMTSGDNLFVSNPGDSSGLRGDYDINTGHFRADDHIYGRFGKVK
jgi:hypothetical protein